MEELFRLIVRNQVNILGGPYYGTKYTLNSACKRCGSGAEPIGPRLLPEFKSPEYDMFCTTDGEIIVSMTVANALGSVGVKSLEAVIEAGTARRTALRELRAEGDLPRFSSRTVGYERECPCAECGRDGFFEVPDRPLRLTYENLDAYLVGKHVLATFERFGNSRLRSRLEESVFARPLYVVKRAIVDCLRSQHIRGVDFEPVFLV